MLRSQAQNLSASSQKPCLLTWAAPGGVGGVRSNSSLETSLQMAGLGFITLFFSPLFLATVGQFCLDFYQLPIFSHSSEVGIPRSLGQRLRCGLSAALGEAMVSQVEPRPRSFWLLELGAYHKAARGLWRPEPRLLVI